ncbi:MAG: 3'(2'),5'-bisphosphate nucleotidase CysQ [Rhizobiaceae bacterium]|nr:3'(2'),5'-bisphosphate nucleotidase CysQ [Rhizobiaceae bacterium]
MQATEYQSLDDQSLIETIALEAGKIALKHFKKEPEVWYKGISKSPVSEADLEIDEYLKTTLLQARPHYGWLSEETEDNNERLKAKKVFVVDPIDGTRAFIAGTDEWCVSIGIVENNKPVNGVLFAPVRQKLYSAARGQGAFINGIGVKEEVVTMMLEPHRVIIPQEVAKYVSEEFVSSVEPVGGVRSLALRITGLIEDYADGIYVRKNSRDWDMVAAHLIVEEAGFQLVDLALEDVVYNKSETRHGLLIAAHPSYTEKMKNALQMS